MKMASSPDLHFLEYAQYSVLGWRENAPDGQKNRGEIF
jgi:hypothetical protein